MLMFGSYIDVLMFGSYMDVLMFGSYMDVCVNVWVLYGCLC